MDTYEIAKKEITTSFAENNGLFEMLMDNDAVVYAIIKHQCEKSDIHLRYYINSYFDFISDRLKDNADFMFSIYELIVNSNCTFDPDIAFIKCSDRLKDDKQFITKMIKIRPTVIKYASRRLQNDKELVLLAIDEVDASEDEDYLYAVMYSISKELLDDEDVILAASQKCFELVNLSSIRLQELMLKALSKK